LDRIIESFIDKCTVFFGYAIVDGRTLRGRKIKDDSPTSLSAVRLLRSEANRGAEVVGREIQDVADMSLLKLSLN
jgi:hypothetical protein